MAIDLFILGLVVLFGAIGALTGGARQLAQMVGMAAAFFCARPLGNALGPRMAHALQAPLVFGVVAATLASFILVLVLVRVIATQLFRGLFARRDREDHSIDRGVGMAIGALKVIIVAYVMLSGLTFAEEHVSIAGRRIGVSPKDSLSFAFARRFNLFEMTQFRPVRDLATIARALEDPDRAKRLQNDPAFRALRKDPRFRTALDDEKLHRALEDGNYPLLLQSNRVLELVQDPTAAARLSAAAEASD